MNKNKKPRSCGQCSACCTALLIEDPKLQKPMDVACPHLATTIAAARGEVSESPPKGCGDYSKRVGVCFEFECLWLRGTVAAEHRPDRCGVIWDIAPDHLDPTHDTLVATEVRPGAAMMGDMGALLRKHMAKRVVIVQGPNGAMLYGPEEKKARVLAATLLKPPSPR